MSRVLGSLGLFISLTMTLTLFQNCGEGYEAETQSLLSLNEGSLILPQNEESTNDIRSAGRTSEELDRIAEKNFNQEQLDVIAQGSSTLKLEKVYYGEGRVLYFGFCDTRWDSYIDLVFEGYAGNSNVGICGAYNGDRPEFQGKDIMFGQMILRENTKHPLKYEDSAKVYVNYWGGAFKIPVNSNSLFPKVEMRKHIRSRTLVIHEIDPDVDRAYAMAGQNGRVDFTEFERIYEELKNQDNSTEPETAPTQGLTRMEIERGVIQAFQEHLGRHPQSSGLNYWTNTVVNGEHTLEEAQYHISRSPEAQLRAAYLEHLGREPDQAGMDFWHGHVRSGKITLQTALDGIAQSNEAKIRGFYLDILKREPDQAGMDFWLNKVNSRQVTLDHVRNKLLASEEYQTKKLAGIL